MPASPTASEPTARIPIRRGTHNSTKPADVLSALLPNTGPLLYNPAAYVAPQGLTFGDTGRNSLNIPNRLNFDMAVFKNFPIKESYSFQFRAEAFNIFNHTQWNGVNGSISCYGGANNSAADSSCTAGGWSSQFLQPSGAHLGRIFQFGLKFLFWKREIRSWKLRNSKLKRAPERSGALFYCGAWVSENEERSLLRQAGLTAFGMTAPL